MASTSVGRSSQRFRNYFFVSNVGYICNQIVGAKLPSNRQVLRVFFYNVGLRVVNLTAKESASLVIQEVKIFCQKARIPTRRNDHCIVKLLKLYDEWKSLQKNLTRNAGKQKEKRDLFEEIMDDLFGIAYSDALEQIKIEEDKNFLLLQRKKGRPGSMVGVDLKLKHREARAMKRTTLETARKKRTYDEMEKHFSLPPNGTSQSEELTSGSQSSDCDDNIGNSTFNVQDVLTKATDTATAVQATRGTLQFFTPRLSEVFDRCKITNRSGVYILMTAAEALGLDTGNLASSFQHLRTKFREAKHKEIQDKFEVTDCRELVLH